MTTSQAEIKTAVRIAIEEDLGRGDVTTDALIPVHLQARGVIIAKSEGILCGVDVAREVFRQVDPGLRFTALLNDGERLRPTTSSQDGELRAIAGLSGAAASILKGERVALNFLQSLSGVATATRAFVESVEGYGASILDTRKTTPGLRALQKRAVTVGGGINHRRDLSDAALIKDNHLAAGRLAGLSLTDVARRMREAAPSGLLVEIEVESIEQAREAAAAGVDIIMLDNMSPVQMAEAVDIIGGRAATEASGGVTLANVRQIAAAGVDRISVGALTHSAAAVDISLDLVIGE